MTRKRFFAFAATATLVLSAQAHGQAEDWSLHGQITFVDQYHPAFKSAYRGPNSMAPESAGRETIDLTLYAGLRLWDGGEAYANPEIDQGFGLSNTLGAAGFPSGECAGSAPRAAAARAPAARACRATVSSSARTAIPCRADHRC